MYRFFSPENYQEHITITGSDAFHIANVLRLKVGAELQLVTADSLLLSCEITNIANNNVRVTALEVLQKLPNHKRLLLAQGLIKGDKMDMVIQKAVELGATDIVPLTLERCVVELESHKAAKRVERWQKIAYEAAKQSKHSLVPNVHAVTSLTDFLVNNTCTLCILAYEAEYNRTLKELLRNQDLKQDTAILIGPEGGFAPSEVAQACQNKFVSVSLGDQILRTETAPLMLLSILKYERE